jgi:putative addiction module component (TIGR02574 family)
MSATTQPVQGSGGGELTPELVQRLLKLSEDERVGLGNFLLDSVAYPGLDSDAAKEAWRQELARRIEDVRAGRVQLLDADEALRRLREKYGEADEE